jgi:hypothetical protein
MASKESRKLVVIVDDDESIRDSLNGLMKVVSANVLKIVPGESANVLTSFASARFSFSYSAGRDGRRCNSSVQKIDSNEAPPSGIEYHVEPHFVIWMTRLLSSHEGIPIVVRVFGGIRIPQSRFVLE